MQYKEALKEALKQVKDGERIADTIKNIRSLTKKKVSDKQILDDFIDEIEKEEVIMRTSTYLDWEEREWVHRSDVFAEMSFDVNLSSYEIKHNRFVMGHRVVPFLDAEEWESGKLSLENTDGQSLSWASKSFQMEDAMPFIIYAPPYGSNELFQLKEDAVWMDTYDLRPLADKGGFQEGDLLRFTPLDYSAQRYMVERIPAREYKREEIAMNAKLEMLKDAIEEVLVDTEDEWDILDYVLFQAFGCVKDELNGHAGYPIVHILNHIQDNGDFLLNTSSGTATIHLEDEMSQIFGEDAEGILPGFWEDELEGLEGLLQDLGISYGEKFIALQFIRQLQLNGNTDKNAMLDILFAGRHVVFYDNDQVEEFEEAIDELEEQINEEWKGIRLAPKKQRCLSILSELKEKVVGILRSIDQKNAMLEDLNVEKMRALVDIEMMLDSILDVFLMEKDFPYIVANQMLKNHKTIAKNLDKLGKSILSDL